MTELVTLAEAKSHLKLTWADGDPRDADLVGKLDEAHAIIIEYCTTTAHWREAAATWDADTVPKSVKAAIKLELGELWQFRGDERGDDGAARTEGFDLSPTIRALLTRQRDPVIA